MLYSGTFHICHYGFLCTGNFILTPTILLIVYPTRLFRRCIECCRFRRWHALHMFVESFQGQYKDGTNGARDLWMVSASFLILRMLILASFLPHHKIDFYPPIKLQCTLLIIATGFYSYCKTLQVKLKEYCRHLIFC